MLKDIERVDGRCASKVSSGGGSRWPYLIQPADARGQPKGGRERVLFAPLLPPPSHRGRRQHSD
eukprot:365203-Chlamydomonas_euryale.AAC.28